MSDIVNVKDTGPKEVGAFPVPNIKDVVLATINPQFVAIRDFLQDESVWIRTNIELQNKILIMLQETMNNYFQSLMTQIMKSHDIALRVGGLEGEKADIIQLQTQQIDYQSRIALYEAQVRDFNTALGMSIGIMSEFQLQLAKIKEITIAIDHAYVLNNAPPEVQDQYNLMLASLQLMADRAGEYVRDLPTSLK